MVHSYFYCNCKSSSWDFLFVLIYRQAWLWDALISLSNGGDAYLTARVDLVYVSSRYEYNIDRTIRSLGNKSSYCHMRDYCSWYVYYVFLRIFKQDFVFWHSSIAVPLDAHSCSTLVHVISGWWSFNALQQIPCLSHHDFKQKLYQINAFQAK